MDTPLASVIIPNYNGIRFLPELRDSLRAQSEPRFSVTVVDDVSSDESAAFIAAQWPEAELIRNARNLGFAGTCNRGLEAARTAFVALLNNDTHVDQHWMREGLAAFASERIAGVASLILLHEPPHLVDSAGDLYSVAGGAQKRCHLRGRESISGLSSCIFSACGASAFYRREVLARLGNLDEKLGSYYDDVDIGFRLAWAGYDCVFAPRSICYHHLSASYDPKGWNYHFNSARNAEVIWQAYMPPALRHRYRWARRWFLMAQAMYKLKIGCLRAHMAGRSAGRRMIDHIEAKRATMTQFANVPDDSIETRLYHDWRRLHLGPSRGMPA